MQSRKIPILDLNLSAFQHLHGNTPELVNQSGRVVFMFNADDAFYKLSELYNLNVPINCIDFVNAIREMKSKMLSLKNYKEYGKGHGNYERNFNR